ASGALSLQSQLGQRRSCCSTLSTLTRLGCCWIASGLISRLLTDSKETDSVLMSLRPMRVPSLHNLVFREHTSPTQIDQRYEIRFPGNPKIRLNRWRKVGVWSSECGGAAGCEGWAMRQRVKSR